MRVTGIFTGTTSSPSSSLRQSYDRYAIRAGRNLPDKEFRYLRTVIVTAAVHRGFSSQLHPSCDKLTAPFNLPAPGRRQPLYVVFDFAETCVFVKQSPCAFHCGPLELALYRGTPSPEVTGLICRVPERAFSRAPLDILLVYLCRFEVRFPFLLLRGFSWQRELSAFRPYGLLLCVSPFECLSGFAWRNRLTRIEPDSHNRLHVSFCVTPSYND